MKILLVQLFSNGDCLYATAVARQIKEDFPGCRLVWAVASFCKSIITNNPYVDEILEVSSVAKNDVRAYRKFKKEIQDRHRAGEWDNVFFTHIMDDTQANYDGCIRSAIFNGYPNPITVPVTPVVRLSADETQRAEEFARQHELSAYTHVLLFEFAPQSGQSKMTKELAIAIAESLAAIPGTAIILSSALKIEHANRAIIDGSRLTFRETAALTHYCTFLLGCSSGITWISTSDAAKQLPMLQLLNPYTAWVNPISRDFRRFGLDDTQVLELFEVDESTIGNCVQLALENFAAAKAAYQQPLPLHFKTTRNIVYNLLCYFQFAAIGRHIRVNRKQYGNNGSFYIAVLSGFVIFPFRLISNLLRKKVFNR